LAIALETTIQYSPLWVFKAYEAFCPSVAALESIDQAMNCRSILFSATFVWMTRTQFVSSAMNPIVIKGNLLYDSVTKERFYIKGVTYDPIPNCIDGGTDVLAGTVS
jgi:hypothetical protein